MTTYTDWQQRQLDAEEPKREPAMPTQSFDDWLQLELALKEVDAVDELVADGWSLDGARKYVRQMIEDGETVMDTADIVLPPGLLFSDTDLAMLSVLLQERPVVATKLMLLRLIDKIDAQLKSEPSRIRRVLNGTMTCAECKGRGEMSAGERHGFHESMLCPACRGNGVVPLWKEVSE